MTDEVSKLSIVGDALKDASSNELSSADLLELKNKLVDELRSLEVARLTAEQGENTSSTTELQEAVSELKDQLLEESNNGSLKELIVRRLEMHGFLCDVVFKEDQDERDSMITSNCQDELPVASEIMRIQKDVEALQETYHNLRIDNLNLQHENIALMKKLKDHQEKAQSISTKVSKDKDYRSLKSEFDVRCKSLDILKNIIPRLVVGAGRSDPHLQDLILQCGESLSV